MKAEFPRKAFALTIGSIGAALFVTALWGDFLTLGPDEPFELVKGLMFSQGRTVVARLWNDQPPVYSAILGGAVSLFGPSLLAARAIAAAFGLLLQVAVFIITARLAGWRAAVCACVVLFLSPSCLQLSASAMAEVPAFAVALSSAACMLQMKEGRSKGWLAGSGLLFGLALQMKLTAALVLPALVLELIVDRDWDAPEEIDHDAAAGAGSTFRTLWPAEFTSIGGEVLLWGSMAGIAFGVVAALTPGWQWDQLWHSHQLAAQSDTFSQWDAYRWSPLELASFPEGLLVLALACSLFASQIWTRKFRMPLCLLVTAAAVHVTHRPWWYYYILHFDLPLAMLAGIVTQEILNVITLERRSRFRGLSIKVGMAALLLIEAGLVCTAGSQRLKAQVSIMAAQTRASEDPLLQALRRARPGARLLYTRDVKYAYASGLPLIPEIALLPAKRFWSQAITEQQILDTVKKHRPDLLLLSSDLEWTKDWLAFLEGRYRLAFEDQDHKLFVAGLLSGSAEGQHARDAN